MHTQQTTDVLVVGAGVIGLSLAWELSRRGLRVVILERGDVGREASWAGAGMIPARISEQSGIDAAAPLQNLLALSRKLHPLWSDELLELTGNDNEYRRCGAWYLDANGTESSALWEQCISWNAAGVSAHWHSRAELPPLLGTAWQAGFFAPDEAQIRNPRHLRALHSAAVAGGVRIETNTEPRAIVRQGERSIEVLTDACRWSAAQLCLCGGAWSADLGRLLGVNIPVRPVRGQMLLLDSPEAIPSIINHGPRYIVPRRDGMTLVGSTEEEAGFVKETTASALAELREFANQAIPSLTPAETRQCWSGLRPASTRPWLSRLSYWDNAWVAAGHYRHGLALSPGTAIMMAAMIYGETPPLDAAWFQLPQ